MKGSHQPLTAMVHLVPFLGKEKEKNQIITVTPLMLEVKGKINEKMKLTTEERRKKKEGGRRKKGLERQVACDEKDI